MDQIPIKRSNSYKEIKFAIFCGGRGLLGQLMLYEPTGTLGFGSFLLLQKIRPINGLVNAR
jgi:hypothetical protein